MAKRESTRLAPGRGRSGGPRPPAPVSARRHVKVPDAKMPKVAGRPAVSAESLRQLTLLALRLRVIYGTAVSAELALRRQAAEHDPEIADCLRAGVCDAIADQIRDVQDVVHRLRSGASETNQ